MRQIVDDAQAHALPGEDADDIAAPDRLDRQLALLASDDSLAAVDGRPVEPNLDLCFETAPFGLAEEPATRLNE